MRKAMPTGNGRPEGQPRRRAVVGGLLAGVATAALVAGLLLLAAVWYREHLWLVWIPRDLLLFYLAGLLVVAGPAVAVGILVERRLHLHRALSRQYATLDAMHVELARTNRALRALSSIGHEMIRADDEQTLLTRICQALVDHVGYRLVWAAMIEPGPAKTVRVAARAGTDLQFLDNLGVRYDDSPRGQGPTGTAIREGRIVVVPDSRMHEVFSLWPDRPVAMDWIASTVSLPLRRGERVVGALTMYEPTSRKYGQEELDLLARMAADVSYGLRFLQTGRQRDQTVTLLRQALRMSAAMTRTARELVPGNAGVPEMATMVLRQALALTGSEWGGVGLVARRTGRVDWVASAVGEGKSPPAPAAAPDIYPDDGGRYPGPWGAVLNQGVSVCRNDCISLEGYCPVLAWGEEGARFLALPLHKPDGTVSGVMLLTGGERPYGAKDVRATRRLAMLLDMAASRRRAEEALVLARQRAEAANDAKTQFLANITQELRTPINGILGMAQVAMLEGASGREADNWQTVRDATERLMEIVDNLLELANVEAGSLSPVLREFSLRRILDSLRGAFSVRVGLAGLTLDVEMASDLPDRYVGDPFRLRQILSNLMDNAIRFTPTGTITVRARRYDPTAHAGGARRVPVAKEFQGLVLLLTVADTGIGIPQNRQEAIFESFILGEEYLTKRFGGAGMGLSIAKRLAELLGGSIWLESQVGSGSTFFLAVPLWPVTQAGPEKTASLAASVDLPPLRILVVEDEAINRLALARGLRKFGHQVVEAVNGEDALRRLATEPADVVVMDIQMPVMDGLAAVSHIRGGEVPGLDRRLPVVALTAYALEGDRKRFLDAGMDEFVTKPCDMAQVLQAIARALTAAKHPV